jgi:hypothetical protein
VEYRKSLNIAVIASCLIGLTNCARVPKEAVILSDAVGTDIQQLYTGYRETVRWSFEQIRQNGLTIINERWTPVYINDFVKKGKLIEFAKEENTEAIEYWARKAIARIDQKRQDFLGPLQVKETALLADIDEAFGRTIRANAVVTAHLESISNVKEAQDVALEAVGLKKVRNKINEGITSASEFTTKLNEKVEEEVKQLQHTTVK